MGKKELVFRYVWTLNRGGERAERGSTGFREHGSCVTTHFTRNRVLLIGSKTVEIEAIKQTSAKNNYVQNARSVDLVTASRYYMEDRLIASKHSLGGIAESRK